MKKEECQRYDVSKAANSPEIDSAKFVCEICAIPLDAAGQPLQTGFSRRTMGVSFDSLRNIPSRYRRNWRPRQTKRHPRRPL
ncbi:sugar-binding domain-containing protein [Sorlinia euscelidii]|uniref:sugar-binding domain-containing protein n=1 Tax=Sorlinia euscelidii TaxID=3081148 RepID=UPI00374E16F0